jgi:hypothetical protein
MVQKIGLDKSSPYNCPCIRRGKLSAGIQKKIKAKYEEKYLWIPAFAGMTYRKSMINMNKFLLLLLTYFKYFENLTKC